MANKWLTVIVFLVLLLSGCKSAVYTQTEANVANAKIQAKQYLHKSDDDAIAPAPVVVNPGSYVDATPRAIPHDAPWLMRHIIIRGDQLPFSYYSRIVANGAGDKVLTKYQTGLNGGLRLSLNYSGTVRGALDLLAAKTGYRYEVLRCNTIYWQEFVTRTFDIAFMPGDADYLMGKKSGGASSSRGSSSSGASDINYTTDNTESEYSNLSGKLSVWKDLHDTISQMLSPDGKVTVSQSTTSVTVRDRPTNVQLIAEYIAGLNNRLARQVLVKVQVLSVNLNSGFNFGIDWNMVARAFNKSPFRLNSKLGTPLTLSSLSGGAALVDVPTFGVQQEKPAEGTTFHNPYPAYTILVNALNQQGKASVLSEPRVLCLNNQVCVVRVVNQRGYVASIETTSSPGATTLGTVTSQITPGSVTTGLTLYILPKILNDKVFLQVNADLSDLLSIETSSTQTVDGTPTNSSNYIQYPNVNVKHFNQRSMIKSGDSLILAGFRETRNRAGAQQLLTLQALGGRTAEQLSTEIIMLITPIILDGTS